MTTFLSRQQQLYSMYELEPISRLQTFQELNILLWRDNANWRIPISHKYPPRDWTRVPHDGKQTGGTLGQWNCVWMQWDCRLSTLKTLLWGGMWLPGRSSVRGWRMWQRQRRMWRPACWPAGCSWPPGTWPGTHLVVRQRTGLLLTFAH